MYLRAVRTYKSVVMYSCFSEQSELASVVIYSCISEQSELTSQQLCTHDIRAVKTYKSVVMYNVYKTFRTYKSEICTMYTVQSELVSSECTHVYIRVHNYKWLVISSESQNHEYLLTCKFWLMLRDTWVHNYWHVSSECSEIHEYISTDL